MSELPSLNIEALARLDLRPDEILAVTLGTPDLTAQQRAEVQEWLTDWLADHGQPVAGVLVLPQGSGLAAIRAPEPATVSIDFTGSGMDAEQQKQFMRVWGDLPSHDAPEPVTQEQVERGEKSINDYRRYHGVTAFNIACAVIHRDHDGNVIPCPQGR